MDSDAELPRSQSKEKVVKAQLVLRLVSRTMETWIMRPVFIRESVGCVKGTSESDEPFWPNIKFILDRAPGSGSKWSLLHVIIKAADWPACQGPLTSSSHVHRPLS